MKRDEEDLVPGFRIVRVEVNSDAPSLSCLALHGASELGGRRASGRVKPEQPPKQPQSPSAEQQRAPRRRDPCP